MDNIIYFDLFSDGYDNPLQEFNMESIYIDKNYKKINKLINTGEIPAGTDTYFRIFTNSSGSLLIKNLEIYKISMQSE